MVKSRCSGRAAPNRRSASAPGPRAHRPRAARAAAEGPARQPRRLGLSVRDRRNASSRVKVCQKTLPYRRLILGGLTSRFEYPFHGMMNTDAPARSGRLPHLGVLRFTGPDSLSFLQGQVSNDTRRHHGEPQRIRRVFKPSGPRAGAHASAAPFQRGGCDFAARADCADFGSAAHVSCFERR